MDLKTKHREKNRSRSEMALLHSLSDETEESLKKIPAPLTFEGQGGAGGRVLSQIKVWSNCYKGSDSPPRRFGEVKLSVNGISRGLNKAPLKFRGIMVIEKEK